MEQLIRDHRLVLMEAAIVEQLRRSESVCLDATLANAPLIYDNAAREAMAAIYQGYITLALGADLPILICAPTWKANWFRVFRSGASRAINQDAVSYMQELRGSEKDRVGMVKIGGLIGCKNDCYRPEEGLCVSDAQRFHTWQIERLVEGGVDFLIAETLPNIEEALGISKAMELTGIPYVISFVISRDGRVLDGSSLDTAIAYLDGNTRQQPLGYMANCSHPTFLCVDRQAACVFPRLIGYQANASSLDHTALDNAPELEGDSVPEWGRMMLQLNQTHGIQILGGCCGTGIEHLRYIVENRTG